MIEDTPPKKEVPDWTKNPTLSGTRFGALVKDLRELELEKADLENRIEMTRQLISPLVTSLLSPVRVGDRQVQYFPPSATEKLDRKALVLAGVTPDQLKAGTVAGKKAAYFRVTKLESTPTDGEPITG